MSCTIDGVDSTLRGRCGGDISGVTVTSSTCSRPGASESFTAGHARRRLPRMPLPSQRRNEPDCSAS